MQTSHRKKLISLFCAVAVFASSLPFRSLAGQAVQSGMLTFDDGTLDCLTSSGGWQMKTEFIMNSMKNTNIVSVTDTGKPHGNALKLLRHGNHPIPITHAVEADDSGEALILEFSYKENNFGQPRVWMTGTDADGNSATLQVLDYTGSATWQYRFCAESTYAMPHAPDWRRVRIVFDMMSDTVTMSHWAEDDTTAVTTITDNTSLAAFDTITAVELRPYTRNGDGDAIYLDDLHIYRKTDLACEGFDIPDGAAGVSTRIMPILNFNMPLAPLTEQNISLAFEGQFNSAGSRIEFDEDDYSLSLSPHGNGIWINLKKRLIPYDTYHLSIEGTVYDLWGTGIQVDENLTFTAGALPTGQIQLEECIFTINGNVISRTDSLSAGRLEAQLAIAADGMDAKQFFAALGLYDEDGNLTDIDVQTKSAVFENYSLSVDVPDDGNKYMAKLYIWQSADTAQPYRAFITGGTDMKDGYISARATDISEEIVITDAEVQARMKDVMLMTPTSTNALVKNELKTMDDSMMPYVVNGCAMLPLKFVAECMGADETARNTQEDTMVSLDDAAKILGTEALYDDGGYIIVGKDAKSFNLSDKTDKKILDRALRKMLFDNPTAADIISLLKQNNADNSHPRLMITPQSLESLKDKIANDSTVSKWYEAFISRCDNDYMNTELLKYELQGVRLLVISRKALERISNLSFAYLISGNADYAYKAIDEMMNVCGTNFPDWNQKHFLDVAEMAAAVAIGYDWCYDKINDTQKETILTALKDKAFKYGLMQLRGEEYPTTSGLWADSNQATYPGNWVSVCSGGLTLAALSVGDETEELSAIAGEIVSSCVPHLQNLVAKFAPDGAWKEGPTYWRYSYKYFAFNFDSMRTALGTDFGLSTAPGIHKGAYFMIAMTGSVANFDLANSEPQALSCPQFMWLSMRYGDKALARYRKWFLENFDTQADFTDIIWYNPSYDGDISGIPTETNTREFPIAATRSGYGKDEFYVAFHGADDGGGRIVDLDCGQYIIDLFGNRWVKDMGSEGQMYVSHADEGIYLSDYPYYRMRAEAHNTIVVNPGYWEDQNYSVLKDIERFEYNNRYTLMSSDFTDVYAFKGVEHFSRSVLADKVSMTTAIYDKVKMTAPSDFYWFMHTGGELDVASDGRSAIISSGSNKMHVELVGGRGLKLSKMPAVGLDSSPVLPYGADDSKQWKLYIKANHITEAEFAVVVTPLCGGEREAAVSVDLADFSSLPADGAPTLESIAVNGVCIADFAADKRIYTLKYTDYVGTDGISDISQLNFSANSTGGADVSIELPHEDNRCARITVKKDGLVGYYFVNFEC